MLEVYLLTSKYCTKPYRFVSIVRDALAEAVNSLVTVGLVQPDLHFSASKAYTSTALCFEKEDILFIIALKWPR